MSKKFCTKCGAQLYEDDKYCEYCGHEQYKKTFNESVNEQMKDFSETAQKSLQKAEKNQNFDIVVLIVLLVLFWPAGLIYYLVTKN